MTAKLGILTSEQKQKNVLCEIQLNKLYGYWLYLPNVKDTVSVFLTDPSCRKQQQSRLPLFPEQRGAVSRHVQMRQKALHRAIKVDLMQSRENSVRVHPFPPCLSLGSRMCWRQIMGDDKDRKQQIKTWNQMRMQQQFLCLHSRECGFASKCFLLPESRQLT